MGEVVITSLNPDYPLIRFGTGDLSAILAGTCPTGRTNTRIKGWMGRAHQTTKMRGMFVHPGAGGNHTSRFPEVARARLVVRAKWRMTIMVLQVETTVTGGRLGATLGRSHPRRNQAAGEVELVVPAALPNDGKVIEDARSYR